MNDIQQTDGGSVDPNMAAKVMALFGKIDGTLNELNIDTRDKKQVQQNLMEAIAADLLVRLGSKMDDEGKEKLAELSKNKGEPNLAEISGFFRESFSQEELLEDLSLAIESVLSDFVAEMTTGAS